MSNFSTVKPSQVSSTVPNAEPGPDWPVAKNVWGVAWELHWAGFGTLFIFLALYSLLALVRVGKRFGRKPLFVTINSLLLTLGLTRALYLFLDPYESTDNGIQNPVWLARLLFGVTFPCLTSAFCLIHLAFLEVAKVQLGSKKLQSVRFLGGVIALHFSIVIVAETVTSLKPSFAPLLIVCQSFFILWGILLSASFIYSGSKVILRAEGVRKQFDSIEEGKQSNKAPRRKNRANTTKVAKITFITSILGFVCSALQIYSMVVVYGLYTRTVTPTPWPWWVFQTCFRLAEFSMACTIAYSVRQPSDENNNK